MHGHMNTRQFFVNLYQILNDDGCLATNCNFPTASAFSRLLKALSATFERNILFAHSNVVENAKVMISGNPSSLASIDMQQQAVQAARRVEMDTHLEFRLLRLISLAYRGGFNDTNSENDCF